MALRHARVPHSARTAGAAALAAAAFVALTLAVIEHAQPFQLDHWWAAVVVDRHFDVFTFLGVTVFNPLGLFPLSWLIVGIAGLVLAHLRGRSVAVLFVAAEAVAAATVALVKIGVGRPRPPDSLVETTTLSFPSGHASFATVTAILIVGLAVPARLRLPAGLIAGAAAAGMALSRTFVMAHWLSDVAGGVMVGVAVSTGALAINEWRARHSERSSTRAAADDSGTTNPG
ncbi:MAG: phosphatase PAP2 family protein [Thermoleophilia bacterium]